MKLIILFYLLLVGCTPNIIEVDNEKLEYDQVHKIQKAQADPFISHATPDIVKVADNDDVYVNVVKGLPFLGRNNIKLDTWNIFAINRTEDAKCVLISWKVQDFELESELPFEFVIKSKQTVNVGKMKQTIWSFDDALIALPPSGYVSNMRVRPAQIEHGRFTCDELDSNIKEPSTH